MDVISICVSFVVAILAIAYPILFQVVSGLDEKYSSILINELFNQERSNKYFLILLITSLIAILLWMLKLPPLIDLNEFNFIIDNSATYFLVSNTTALIVFFFLFVRKILIYYTPNKFVNYLIDRHKKDERASDYKYFKAISDLLYFSIKKQNVTISKTISDFMYWAFQDHRDINPEEPVEYPTAYYEVVNKSIEELAQLKNKKLAFLEYRTVGGIWLLGETPGSKISETTYNWLWNNLYLAIEYERDDMIVYYWENAHQFVSFNLAVIDPKYSPDDLMTIINEKFIEERNKERKRFLEFHYALGGLLLYKQRYECIARIFKYTTSIPPRFELLPHSMNEIFDFFMHFRDPYDITFYSISNKYRFPDAEGLLASGMIKKWICEYSAVLYLRQYSIVPHLTLIQPLELPSLPPKQNEKKKWINNLDFFKKLIRNVLDNQILLSKVDLIFLTDEWCASNNKPKPLELIDKLKSKLEESIEDTLVEQKISAEKVQRFYDSSKAILTKTIKNYQKIYNSKPLEDEYNSWFIQGERVIVEKSDFAEDQGYSSIDYDTFFAKRISNKYEQRVAETFYLNNSDSYLLKHEDIFNAIDKLKITNKPDEFIIIGFGQNISYFKDTLKIRGLTEDKYKYIDLINIQLYDRRQFGQSFFIIKKVDLPFFEFKSIDDEQIKKYSLSKIDKEFKIYSSVIDLNHNEALRIELRPIEPDGDLRKSVLVNIALRVEIQWKKSIKNILIQTYSSYREKGLPNNLNDIKEFR